MIKVTGGMNLASILLILTGMQWYLLFNLLAGINQVPEDLKEAARSFGLSRVARWRKLILPAVTPSLITGSITAWGGGWNALILSEYFVYKSQTYQVLGIGSLLDAATYKSGNGVMILLSLLSMIAVVLTVESPDVAAACTTSPRNDTGWTTDDENVLDYVRFGPI